MVEERIQKIFDILTTQKRVITAKELSIELDISTKTVRRDINILNEILKNSGAVINSSSGIGYKFTVNDIKIFEKFLVDEWNEFSSINSLDLNDSQNRINYILKLLLESTTYIKAETIIDQFHISRSQLTRDLSMLKKELERFNLKIKTKPYMGIGIFGTEFNKRLLYVSRYSKNLDKMFDLEQREKVRYYLQKYNYSISKMAFDNFIIHIIISYQRFNRKMEVSLPLDEKLKIIKTKEYDLADEILKNLYPDISMPEDEIAYVTIHLLSKKIITYTDNTYNNLIIQGLKKVKEIININLLNDDELINALTKHCIPLLERLKYKLVLRNPLLEDIKNNVIAFDVATIFCKSFENIGYSNIDENEIAYIALHMAVGLQKLFKKNIAIVCASGMASANLVRHKLINTFGAITKDIDIYDYISFAKIDFEKYDLILTSIPLDIDKYRNKIIKINSLLTSSDIKKINNKLLESVSNKSNLLSKDLFEISFTKRNKYEVIENMCKKVFELQGIDILTEVLNREKVAKTVYTPKIAIPHPLKITSDKNFVSIYINKNGIMWDDSKIYIVILLHINIHDMTYEIENFYDKLSYFLADKTAINKAILCKKFEEFIEIFNSSERK